MKKFVLALALLAFGTPVFAANSINIVHPTDTLWSDGANCIGTYTVNEGNIVFNVQVFYHSLDMQHVYCDSNECAFTGWSFGHQGAWYYYPDDNEQIRVTVILWYAVGGDWNNVQCTEQSCVVTFKMLQ